MPRQTTRRPPGGISRFDYWAFDIAFPVPDRDTQHIGSWTARLSKDAHLQVAEKFKAILGSTEDEGLLKEQELAFRKEPNRQVRSLSYYIHLDGGCRDGTRPFRRYSKRSLSAK